jgi:hypothetical protein
MTTFILALIAVPFVTIIAFKVDQHMRFQRIIERRIKEIIRSRKPSP